MVSGKPSIYMSDVDGHHFGIRVARALVKPGALSDILEYCRSHSVTLLIARCLVSDLEAAQAMERERFILADTLLYYIINLPATSAPEKDSNVSIRPLRLGEESIVTAIAKESFQGYAGHYHADQRLERAKCDEAYVSWIYNSCVSKDLTDEVLVAEFADKVIGFGSVRLNSANEGEFVLAGVLASARQHGAYRALLLGAIDWCTSKRAFHMVTSTQITNLVVQRVWTSAGLKLNQAYYTFHKWFDEP
jgi:hypothetical protein